MHLHHTKYVSTYLSMYLFSNGLVVCLILRFLIKFEDWLVMPLTFIVDTIIHLQSPFLLFITTVPGLTGIMMVTCLLTIAITSSSPLRYKFKLWNLCKYSVMHILVIFAAQFGGLFKLAIANYLLLSGLLLHRSRGLNCNNYVSSTVITHHWSTFVARHLTFQDLFKYCISTCHSTYRYEWSHLSLQKIIYAVNSSVTAIPDII